MSRGLRSYICVLLRLYRQRSLIEFALTSLEHSQGIASSRIRLVLPFVSDTLAAIGQRLRNLENVDKAVLRKA